MAAKHSAEHEQALNLLKSASETHASEVAKAAETAKLQVQQLLGISSSQQQSIVPERQSSVLQDSFSSALPAATQQDRIIETKLAALEKSRLDLELERKQVVLFLFI